MNSGKSAIFDLDGTLAETAPDLIGTANDMMRDAGLPEMVYEKVRNSAGMGGKAMIRAGYSNANIAISEQEVDALYPDFLNRYAIRLDQETTLYDNVFETLDRLLVSGWKIGVCTNKPEGLAVELLKRLGLSDYFPVIVGADTLPVRKPNPEHIWETVRRVGGDRAKSIMIGDSDTDLNAARNAKTPCILTTFGYATEPVHEMGADAIISRFDELPEVLEMLLTQNS